MGNLTALFYPKAHRLNKKQSKKGLSLDKNCPQMKVDIALDLRQNLESVRLGQIARRQALHALLFSLVKAVAHMPSAEITALLNRMCCIPLATFLCVKKKPKTCIALTSKMDNKTIPASSVKGQCAGKA